MYGLGQLSVNKKYLISGYRGQWYFLKANSFHATFYRFTKYNRRVSLRLPLAKVQNAVWEKLTFNLSN